MTLAARDTKLELELRLLLAAAARAGIAPTVASAGPEVVAMIRAASSRGDELVRDRRPCDLGCASCGARWKGVLVPEGRLDVGCPSCEGELRPLDPGSLPSARTAILDTETRVPHPSEGSSTVGSRRADGPVAIPERVGPYATHEVLGRGGMGVVVEAEDERTKARVALKLLAGWSLGDLDARLRFEREGKVLTLLAHPHIVRFIERGESEGTLWIAMELVHGRSLAQELEAGALPVRVAVKIARATAEGLAYAHALGLTHRDVKPQNILLGGDGAIKLADFGLARRREESLVLTSPGAVVGTPVYMAPEQLAGAPSGPPCDLYALGVVLYHMVAGEPPFSGTFEEIARQRTAAVPSLRAANASCPEPLAALVARLLAREPSERPSATETARLLAALEPPSSSSRIRGKTTAIREARHVAPGDRVGPFEIEAKLGAGGMGSVHRARRDDGSLVALKLIATPLDPAASERFAREARALAEVNHPGVVRFLDAGESDGISWIATELVPGRSLDELVAAEGPLPEARLLDVADAVARALGALHARGIVHRDVKPQNIMMRSDGGVTLVDLGLVKFLAAQTAFTETGALVGTPHYMAPEQLLGRPVDARTDLYSLGAALYHAAIGRRPFDGESTTAVAFQQVNVAPPGVRSMNARLSGPFSALVGRLLEKHPDRRPASAEAALELVARVRRGEPLDGERARLVRLVLVALAGLLVAGAALWLGARPKEPAPVLAAKALARAAEPKAAADGAAADAGALRRPAPAAGAPDAAPAPRAGGGPRGDRRGRRAPPPAEGAAQDAVGRVGSDAAPAAPTTVLLAPAEKVRERDGARMLLVPSGTYQVGPRKVTVEAYWVDAEEVSVERWNRYVSSVPANGHDLCDEHEPQGYEHHRAGVHGEAATPIRGLEIWDAAAFARWAGGSLPTRDQWEVAVSILGLGGTLREWTLDFTTDGASGRLGHGPWLGTALEVRRRTPREDLASVGFRCVIPAKP